MKVDSATLYTSFAMSVPVGILLLAWFVDRWHAGRGMKPPQQEKLLRPAGYSLGIRLEKLQDCCLEDMMLACLLCTFGGVSAIMSGLLLGYNFSVMWSILALMLFVGFAAFGSWRVLRVFRGLKEARNVRLGLRGEQAVAEALHEAADAGYRIFHDIPAGENWNIDHVAVGTRGVFLIETKARRRRTQSQRETGSRGHLRWRGVGISGWEGCKSNSTSIEKC